MGEERQQNVLQIHTKQPFYTRQVRKLHKLRTVIVHKKWFLLVFTNTIHTFGGITMDVGEAEIEITVKSLRKHFNI